MADELTDITIKNLKPDVKEYTRREKGGFGVRVLPTGTKIFFYLYRVDGKRKFFNIGTYKDKSHPNGITLKSARAAFDIEQSKVKALKEGRSDGDDPVLTKKNEKALRILKEHQNSIAPTVSKLVEDFIERHAKRFKRRWEDDERMLNKELVSRYGKLKAEHIRKADILVILEEIIERGSPASAIPKTEGLFEQKLQSLDPIQSWWYQKLQDGEIVSSHPWNCVPSEQAHTNYCEITTKMSSQIRRLSDTGFGIALKKLLPEGWPVKKKHKLNSMFVHKRVNHYELPPLDVCRKHFESMIGESITWDVPHLEDTVTPCSEEFDF